MAQNDDNLDSESSSGIYYDCVDWGEDEEKPSIIRWSSELLVANSESPPLTPRCNARTTALIVMLFYGDVSLEVNSLDGVLESIDFLGACCRELV